ncbi:MAG: hypothetical protein H6719_23400 [Sandaracinaceae bacterium]|nr:hypothetical protein [Sandaracinaceae bacterium]
MALALLASSGVAEAQGDGVYGRLEGDVVLEAGLGGGVAFEGPSVLGAGVLDLRARYLDMAGVLVGAELRPDGSTRVVVGVDVRPLWLARFVLGGSVHDRYWDLLIDSIGVDLGVAITPLDETVGAALMVGFGLDVPLVFFGDGVPGLALRLFGRHVAALATDRYGPDNGANDWIAGATLVLRGNASTGLPGWEPRRYQLP